MDRVRLRYPLFQALDDDGDPLSGGLLYTYEAGTTTNKATYSDKALTTANANPIVLDGRGEATIYFTGTIKLKLNDSAGATVWASVDNIAAVSEPYWCTSRTGGAVGALDSIDGANLADKDVAIVVESTVVYIYELDDDLSGGEASPDIVNPDDNPGTKSWVLQGIYGATSQLVNGTSINEFSTDGTLAGDSDDAVPTEKAVKAYADAGTQTMTNKTLTTPTLTSPVINTGVSGTAIDTDSTLAADSDTLLASQKAAKAYVDSKGYVDRGDPAAVDFSLGDLTMDAWTNLDLSAIVPAGAVAVALYVAIADSTVDSHIWFRKEGNTNQINQSRVTTVLAGVAFSADIIVALDSSRVVEYYADSASDPLTSCIITVKGWWI